MEIKGNGSLTIEELEGMEESLGVKLPEEYKRFMLKYNGGVPKVESAGTKIQGTSENMVLQYLMGHKVNKKLSILRWNEEYKDEIGDEVIVIGMDMGGGIVLLNCEKNTGEVMYYDDAYGLEETTEEINTYEVAGNFEEFVEKLGMKMKSGE